MGFVLSNNFVPLSALLLLCSIATTNSLNLSSIESTLLKSRLSQIRKSIREDYKNILNDKHTFIFPGAGGIDELVMELQSTIPDSKILDWKKYRGNVLTAAFDGEAVGETITDLLLEGCKQQTFHFIGISVGAFCANAAATSLFRFSNKEVYVTLLDPFCGRGIFNPKYGNQHFGKYATRAIQILNTDDPVPTTNDPLPYCCCIDVTNSKHRATFVPLPGDSMHSWPAAYFARHYEQDIQNLNTTLLERGLVITI